MIVDALTDRFARRLAAIALAALALRLGIRAVTGTAHYWTEGYGLYALLAQNLCAGHGYAFTPGAPTAFRVPLYSLIVAATTCGGGDPWPLIAVQALASSGTAVFAGLIARRMAGETAGLLAAAIYALWPYAAWHDVALQDSGIFTFLAVVATWLVMRLRAHGGAGLAAATGTMLGLLLLTRATMLPFALVALVLAAWPVVGKPRPGHALLAGAAMLAVLSTWLERSHRLTGAYGLGTEGGASLYAGNHPLTFSAFPQGSIDESRARIFAALAPADRAQLARLDEAQKDGWYRDRAVAAIAADPVAFAARATRKLWIAFGPLPAPRHGPAADLGYAAGWTPFLLLTLAGMWRRRRLWREDLPLHAHFATFAGVTALFWAQTAHRSYLDCFLAVFAAMALVALLPEPMRKRLET